MIIDEEDIKEELLGDCREDTQNYLCLKCDKELFPSNHLLITHETNENCTYFIYPMKYMKNTIETNLSGNLSCHSCNEDVGLFSWQTSYCPGCSSRFLPSFQIFPQKTKLHK
jgi:DNA-directed RNA polymerase subunit RPC12/RpoP